MAGTYFGAGGCVNGGRLKGPCSSKGRDVDIERGLELGAADYMVKPFSTKELMARIKKTMRETGGSGN
jgi:DNA-binding response OmpR family regulator